jgi:glycosyltransferase involved in cell wall biosynthesis
MVVDWTASEPPAHESQAASHLRSPDSEAFGASGKAPTVRVVMAVHEPEIRLLARQFQSLLGQVGVTVRIIVVLDGPQTEAVSKWLEENAGPEVQLLSLTRQQGARVSFLSGLEAALAESADPNVVYAFCDQDDVWYPDKLSRQLTLLRESRAALVHCDARVVDAAGNVIHPSLHRMEQRSRDYTLANLIIMNPVTGMTAIFDRRTAENAVILHGQTGADLLHDHLVALAAVLSGEITYLDEPLVDYVQHGRNTIGASDRASHRIKLAPFMQPGRYVRRCREQFLSRAETYRAVADRAATGEIALPMPQLAEAERLFSRDKRFPYLLAGGIRRVLKGDVRIGRLALRCFVGKTAVMLGPRDRSQSRALSGAWRKSL